MAVTVRAAEPADRAAIAAMAREVVEAGEMFCFESVPDVLEYWLDPRGWTFVAEVEGELLGSHVVKPNQKGRGAHVANAGYMTLAAARGRGVGRAMGEHSLAFARERGFRAMQYNFVVETNADAVHLWTSLGFRVVGRNPEAFRRPSGALADALVMYREL